MDKLQPYWDALRPFGIEAPCRVYLSGPFRTDEVALRFLLHKLGFTLLDRWNARAAQWTICGQGSEEEANPPASSRQTSEVELYNTLFWEVNSPFYLINGSPLLSKRRRNLFRLLKSPGEKNMELGIILLDKGGIDISLMEELLASLFLLREDSSRLQRFLQHISPFLPDELAELLRDDIDSLPFRLGFVRQKLPRFSPQSFLALLEQESCLPFEENSMLPGLYRDTAELRREAWWAINSERVIDLSAGQLWLFADLPEEGPLIELDGKLIVVGPIRPECLDLILQRQPGFFSGLKALDLKQPGIPALDIIGAEARQLISLKLEESAPLSIAALLEGLATSSLAVLGVQCTHQRRAEIGLPSTALPRAAAKAAGLRELYISGFRSLNLTGIELFQNLRTLVLKDNHLKALPSGIGALEKLESLQLFEPELESLPGSFYKLPLKNIWLGTNRLPNHTKVMLNRIFPAEAFLHDEGLRP